MGSEMKAYAPRPVVLRPSAAATHFGLPAWVGRTCPSPSAVARVPAVGEASPAGAADQSPVPAGDTRLAVEVAVDVPTGTVLPPLAVAGVSQDVDRFPAVLADH